MTKAELEMQQVETPKSGDRVISASFIFVAIRCTIQYVVLPFILPFVGLTNDFSVILSTILEIVALGAIAFNLLHLWNTDWRKRYLILSMFTAPLILIFLYFDILYLLNMGNDSSQLFYLLGFA